MDSLKLAMFPNTNKIRSFPRTVSDNNILHTAKWKHKPNHLPNRGLFTYADGRPKALELQRDSETNKAGSDSNIIGKVGKQSPNSSVHSWAKASRGNVLDGDSVYNTQCTPKRCVMNNAFEIQVNNNVKTVLEAKRHTDVSKNAHCHAENCDNLNHNPGRPLQKRAPFPSRTDLDGENNVSDVTDEELEKLPNLDCTTKSTPFLKSKMGVSTQPSSSSDNAYDSLSEVRDEELQQLPDLGTPSCTASRKSDQKVDMNRSQQNNTPEMVVVNKNKRIHQLKRSISSIESDEDFTSFFGSIRNRNKRKDDDIDEEDVDEPIYFSGYMSVVSGHPNTIRCEPGLRINRAYSAESFMKRRESDGINSRMSPRKSSSFLGDYDKNDNVSDRLRIRRGALAEPEKMLISQELREKTQRGVEKRKTFMRKVSQFFNLHLRLNLEEDLI